MEVGAGGAGEGAGRGSDTGGCAPSMRCSLGLPLLVRAGSAILFDYRLYHRGLPNLGQGDRPVLYAVFARSGCDDVHNFSAQGHSVFDSTSAWARLQVLERRSAAVLMARSTEPLTAQEQPVARAQQLLQRTAAAAAAAAAHHC